MKFAINHQLIAASCYVQTFAIFTVAVIFSTHESSDLIRMPMVMVLTAFGVIKGVYMFHMRGNVSVLSSLVLTRARNWMIFELNLSTLVLCWTIGYYLLRVNVVMGLYITYCALGAVLYGVVVWMLSIHCRLCDARMVEATGDTELTTMKIPQSQLTELIRTGQVSVVDVGDVAV